MVDENEQQPEQQVQIPVERYLAALEARHERAMQAANREIAALSVQVEMLQAQLRLPEQQPDPPGAADSPARRVAPTARTNAGRAGRSR